MSNPVAFTFAYDSSGRIQYATGGGFPNATWPTTLATVTFDNTSTPTGAELFANQDFYLIQNGMAVASPTMGAQQLAYAKAAQVAMLAQARDAAIASGFTSQADGTSRTYPSTLKNVALIQEQATYTLLGTATYPLTWYDSAGTEVSLTEAQFKQLASDFGAVKAGAWAKFEGYLATVEAATTIAEVQAVTWA